MEEFYNRAVYNGMSKLGKLGIRTNRSYSKKEPSFPALRDGAGEKTIAGEPARESIR